MKNQSETIRKFLKTLNEGGNLWLPNIQRNFVWKEVQIEKLFDSLMRDYPIGTLLTWKTKSNIQYRGFVDNYNSSENHYSSYKPENKECKTLILDGQQRLQSLYIGLCGYYNGKELYFDILSGKDISSGYIKYNFKFRKIKPSSNKWVKIKDIVFRNDSAVKLRGEIEKSIKEGVKSNLSEDRISRIDENISLIFQVFKIEDRIIYQELDSIDNPSLYSDDDVVEIFIRANSGGTPLGKSDLLFSLLTASWSEAEEKIEDLLTNLNKNGYAFTRDFILKTCLTLLNKGASYRVDKFREEGIREQIIDNWGKIAGSIEYVKDFLYESTYIRSKKALRSYLTLIPLIYFHYHYSNQWASSKGIGDYITKTLLASSFGGNPDMLIDNCIREIKISKDFVKKRVFSVIQSSGRSLDISRKNLLSQNYSKKNDLHLIFNLWYKNINYYPSYQGNELNIDHIFPTSYLTKEKDPNNMKRIKYKQDIRDQIANLMLLTKDENRSKSDIIPSEWFKEKSPEYLKKHLIPNKPDLWHIDKFDEFISERKKMILHKFRKEIRVILIEKNI